MFSASHPYNICFNIELPMKNGADIECGVGREREGERERERNRICMGRTRGYLLF